MSSIIVAWVAVGVFGAVINGQPGLTAVANDSVFRTEAACQEHLNGVRQRAGASLADKDSPLVAFGVKCVKVELTDQANG